MDSIITPGSAASTGEVFAGIDWGSAFHRVCLLDEHGQVLHQQRVHHTVAGFTQLDQLLTGSAASRGRLRVAVERAEGLLIDLLRLAEDLRARSGALPDGRDQIRRL